MADDFVVEFAFCADNADEADDAAWRVEMAAILNGVHRTVADMIRVLTDSDFRYAVQHDNNARSSTQQATVTFLPLRSVAGGIS
jgi:hypothetical protein